VTSFSFIQIDLQKPSICNSISKRGFKSFNSAKCFYQNGSCENYQPKRNKV